MTTTPPSANEVSQTILRRILFFFFVFISTNEYAGNTFMDLKVKKKCGRSAKNKNFTFFRCFLFQWPSTSFELSRFLSFYFLIKNSQFIQEQMFTFLGSQRTWQYGERVWRYVCMYDGHSSWLNASHEHFKLSWKLPTLCSCDRNNTFTCGGFRVQILMNYTPIRTICISLPRFSSVALQSRWI